MKIFIINIKLLVERSLHLPRILLSFTHSLRKKVIFLYSTSVSVDNLVIKYHRFLYSQITPKVHKTLWRPCFQSGLSTPKVSKVLLQSNREFNGLSALGRNLELKTSVTIVSSPAWDKISRAKFARVISSRPE